MTKEAMKLALEALQTLHDENMDYLTRNKLGGENNQCMVFAREAITALREALAKPDFWDGYVPEPVKQQALDKKAENARELGLDYEPAQPQVRTGNCLRVGVCASEGHKIQAQRTWVGLTDEEITAARNLNIQGGRMRPYSFAKAIEAKLRERNT